MVGPGELTGSKNGNWRGGSSGKGVCRICGGPTWIKSCTQCKRCYNASVVGEANPFWGHFTSTNPTQDGDRMQRRNPKGMCERCGTEPALDWHHVEYDPPKLMALCRRCHMIVDGRMEQLQHRDRS